MRKLLFSGLLIIFFLPFICQASSHIISASIGDFAYAEDGSINGKVDGETLKFKPHDRGLLDYESYFADSKNYSPNTKVGDFYLLDISKTNAESGRVHKLHSDGKVSNYVWTNQLVSISTTINPGGTTIQPNPTTPTIGLFSYSLGKINGTVDGEALVFEPYSPNGLPDQNSYIAYSKNYDKNTKIGDDFLLHVPKSTPNSGRLFKLHSSDGKVANYVWKNQLVTISGGSTATTKAPKPYSSVLFPKVCDGSKNPLKCWSGQMFNYASVVVGSIAVVAVMVGGVLYIVSGGNPERIGLGKKIMFNALMGVATIVLANWFFRSVLGIGSWGL